MRAAAHTFALLSLLACASPHEPLAPPPVDLEALRYAEWVGHCTNKAAPFIADFHAYMIVWSACVGSYHSK